MSFEAAWGFDPEKAIQAQASSASGTETEESTYSAEEHHFEIEGAADFGVLR